MPNHVRINDVNVVDFPPPVSDGQKQWERRLTAELRRYLPPDQAEANEVLAILKAGVERRSTDELLWQRTLKAAYILSMFPEDYRAARRIISGLFSEDE